ncbi:MAG: thioredoxin family protein [Myxococcota bacterium]|nr:thioredoxin family protein [Myxococcota bacterium]
MKGHDVELLSHIGAGVVGGLILNIMPCVLPVLAFKVQGWVHQSDIAPAERRKDALAFLAGALFTFALLAGLVMVLRASGQSVGWGMQMQNAPFVGFMVALLFAFGLNAIGVFELSFAVRDTGPKEGLWASFSHGALITLVSTPCSAPILGAAVTAALARDANWYQTLILFWSIGFGLSLPVLAVGFIPGASRLIPRPGAWMNTFKIFVGFTLFGAAVWLFETFQQNVSIAAANDFLWFLLCLAIALWYFEQVRVSSFQGLKRAIRQVGAVGALVGAGVFFLHFEPAPLKKSDPFDLAAATAQLNQNLDKIKWLPYSEKLKTTAAQRQQPIFVDFTADWCVSCKAFEKSHIEIDAVRLAFARTGILPVKADLTKAADHLWDVLATLGRTGIPVYVIYLPDGTHDLFAEGPPTGLVERLDAAAEKFPKARFKDG